MTGKHGTLRERFERYYIPEPNSGCWLWFSAVSPTGYGYVYAPPRNMVRAHIVAWELYRGPRNGFHVLHSCDNPSCVNPEHLCLGTHQENIAERDARGRQALRHGIKNGRAILTEAEVLAIRADLRQPRFIARAYPHISLSVIKKIRYRTIWKHLP